MERWRTQVDELLAVTFDPAQPGSAAATLDAVLQAAGDRQVTATRMLLNPDTEDGPLAQLLGRVREQFVAVLDAVARLTEQVSAERAGAAATRAAMERSAVKGVVYEEKVAELVTELVGVYGDVTEPVGRTPGMSGSLIGDLIVHISPEESAQNKLSSRYTVEVKDRRRTLRATLDELTAAKRNRDAGAAIAVFSHQDHAPIAVPFRDFGDCAIVVLNKDELDTSALRLACAWARWVAQRDTYVGDQQLPDPIAFSALLAEGRRALDQLSAFRRAQTLAKKHIDEGTGHVEVLTGAIADVLTRLRALTPQH